MKRFFGELRRRNVLKVAIAYLLIAWLLLETAAILIPMLESPGGLMDFIVALIAAGFPIALVIAWRFEMTPAGMKRTEHLTADEFIPYWSRRKFAVVLLSIAALAAALQIWRMFGT